MASISDFSTRFPQIRTLPREAAWLQIGADAADRELEVVAAVATDLYRMVRSELVVAEPRPSALRANRLLHTIDEAVSRDPFGDPHKIAKRIFNAKGDVEQFILSDYEAIVGAVARERIVARLVRDRAALPKLPDMKELESRIEEWYKQAEKLNVGEVVQEANNLLSRPIIHGGVLLLKQHLIRITNIQNMFKYYHKSGLIRQTISDSFDGERFLYPSSYCYFHPLIMLLKPFECYSESVELVQRQLAHKIEAMERAMGPRKKNAAALPPLKVDCHKMGIPVRLYRGKEQDHGKYQGIERR